MIEKLMLLARGDFELVNRAIRECREIKRWRWWRWRERRAADLYNVVQYIVRETRI